MSELKKRHELPDLPRLEFSVIGELAARLIEYGDFTAAQPLMDALEERGRTGDVFAVRNHLAGVFCEVMRQHSLPLGLRWKWTAEHLLGLFAFDLFPAEVIFQRIEESADVQLPPESLGAAQLLMPDAPGPVTYIADGDIPDGSPVQIHHPGPVVRVAPANEVAQS